MAGRRTPMPPNLEQKGGATGWPDNVRDGSERAWSGTGRRNMRPTLPNLERKRGAIEWPDSVPNGCERGRRGEGTLTTAAAAIGPLPTAAAGGRAVEVRVCLRGQKRDTRARGGREAM